MGLTRALAEFAVGISGDEIPAAVRSKVRQHVIDHVACSLAAMDVDPAPLVREYAERVSAKGPCTTYGGTDLAPEWAAFVNGTVATCYENDDYHPGALIHPGAVVIPAALAVAEEVGATEEQTLTAIAVGFETVIRISAACQPGMNLERHIHPTSALGAFGGASAAARLLELSPERTLDALGVAGSHGGGSLEYSLSGGSVKRCHAGLAAMAGVRSARLAAMGMTGPGTVLEGPRGVLQAYSNDVDLTIASEKLGLDWQLKRTATKPHFCNGLMQAPLEALLGILAEGTDPQSISRVRVGVDRMCLDVCGEVGPRPRDLVTAQFSLHFGLGMVAILGGAQAKDYRQAQAVGFELPDVIDFARRVKVFLDDEADGLFPQHFFARVRVDTNDGAHLERALYAPGSSDNPITEEQLLRKLGSASAEALSRDEGDSLKERLLSFGSSETPVSGLVRILSAGPR